MMNSNEVKVIFRKSTLKEFKNVIYALFPEIGYRIDFSRKCSTYPIVLSEYDETDHYYFIQTSTLAKDTDAGYKELFVILVNAGYTNLKIIKRSKPIY